MNLNGASPLKFNQGSSVGQQKKLNADYYFFSSTFFFFFVQSIW